MAHTYNGPGWDQRGLVAFFVFYLETFAGWRGGGFGGWWKRPYLASSVPPGPPCQPQPPDHLQSGVSNTDSVLYRGFIFYSVLCRGCVFFIFSPHFTKKESDLRPTRCFHSWKILCTGSSSWQQSLAILVYTENKKPPLLDVLQMCMLLNCVLECKFLNPTIQRAGHHTARVKSHGGLKKRQ